MFDSIDYPVDLRTIVVVGWLRERARTFTIRPASAGNYRLYVWPRGTASARWVYEYDLSFESAVDDPQRVVFDATRGRTAPWREWEWSLTRQDSVAGRVSIADAIGGTRSVAGGELSFDEEVGPQQVRTIVWSCNQPFVTDETGAGAVEPHNAAVMSWYQDLANGFDPQTIWGLGDTGYADGTPATDFVNQVYDSPGWEFDPGLRSRLRDSYGAMYRYHWSFREMQHVMGHYAHILMWDDHEIHDGFGSESIDFSDSNLAMFEIARDVADKYILNAGPRVRAEGDAHQAYVYGSQASFVFDTRTSRNYADPGGQVVSAEQLSDFREFCQALEDQHDVHFLLLGSTVPLIYLKEFVAELGSKAPKTITDVAAGVRDDLRDSWHSPGNRQALRELLAVVRNLLLQRPDLHVVTISGDVHVSNAFQIWPLGFVRPIYQLTSSAITNREHLSELGSELLSLSDQQVVSELGLVRRIWPEIFDPNVLCVETEGNHARFTLKVLPVDGSTATDQHLVLD